jgi:hypothetical protein
MEDPMRMRTLSAGLTIGSLVLLGCGADPSYRPIVREGVAPVADAEREIERLRASIEDGDAAVAEVAAGAIQFDVAPEVFGTTTPIDNRLFYVAWSDGAGNVSGRYSYTQSYDGSTFRFRGSISCLHLYDFDGGVKNRAKLGGPIEWTDAGVPPDSYIWWQQIDNDRSPGRPPDKSTLGGIGTEAANDAFCNAPTAPRFGPFEVDRGDVLVRAIPAGTAAAR